MQDRIEQEIEMLRQRFPQLERNRNWIRIPNYPLPEGWNRTATDVAFEIPPQYPGTPPYGICTPVGLMFRGAPPDSYTPSHAEVPFAGTWGRFSWAPEEQWRPTRDPHTGTNLLNWAIGFAQRFKEGK